MRAILSVFVLVSIGCVGPRSRVDEEALQADLDRSVASCRCHIPVSDGSNYDIPCGTTFCLGTIPVQCSLDGAWTESASRCDSDYADQLITGVCRQSYPGDYPIDCAAIIEPGECESYGGCFFEPAPCMEATYGCEGFVNRP